MTSPPAWQECETFGGDKSYESPVFAFGGAATIYLNPYDAEGAALTLQVAPGLRDSASASAHLTLEEASSLAEWLLRGVAAVREEV